MKKVIYFAVVASVAFASCTKNEVRPVEDTQDRQITFQAVVHKASTKALLNTNSYPSDGPSFGTFAYLGSDTYINNAEVKNMTSATSAYAWTTDPAYYWPKQGSLTFMSYSPYSICDEATVTCDISSSAPDQGIVIPNWDVDKHQTVDVMIADRKDHQQANGNNGGWNGVPTVFRHKLAQVVDFKLNTTENYAKIDGGGLNTVGSKQFFVNEIGIYKVKHEAKFVSSNAPSNTSIGEWSAWSDSYLSYDWSLNNNNGPVNEFTYTDAGTTCPKTGQSSNLSSGDYYNIKDYGYLLVMPQNFTGSTLVDTSTPPTGNTPFIKFVYTIRTWWGNQVDKPNSYTDEQVTVYQTLAAIHGSTDSYPKGWEINKRYTYEIKVSLDQIYWAPSVENWEDATAPSFTF